jgi:hypothetical protein
VSRWRARRWQRRSSWAGLGASAAAAVSNRDSRSRRGRSWCARFWRLRSTEAIVFFALFLER